jgi:hypothetical protein
MTADTGQPSPAIFFFNQGPHRLRNQPARPLLERLGLGGRVLVMPE